MRTVAMLSVVLAVAVLGHVSHAQETVRTRSGLVRGTRAGDLVIHKGIPYAAPPTGELRWKPPQAAPKWDAIRDATTFGMACPQTSLDLGDEVRPSSGLHAASLDAFDKAFAKMRGHRS